MKATVVEIRDEYAVLFQADGSFSRMKSENLSIGDVVTMKEKYVFRGGRFSALVAAAFFVFLVGGGIYAYATPSYHVSLDVNPGITMEVNRFERVLGLEASNEEAEEVLEGLELENKNIEEAVSEVVLRLSDLGYFDEGDGNILIAATAKNQKKAEQVVIRLGDTVEEEIQEKGIDAEVTSKIVGYEMVEAARQIEGMTPGKYNLIVNLLKVAPEQAADYSETSIKDIMKMVKESKGTDGKKRSEDASDNEKIKENEKAPDNEDSKGENPSRRPAQAGLKEKNAPIDTPASYRKSQNKPEKKEKPETSSDPEIEEEVETGNQ